MAAYTELHKSFLEELADDYNLGRILGAVGIPQGSVNTNYLLETAKGRFLLRVDEVKSESEVKREIDLLAFLRKHAFPCPHPLQDRMGRYLSRLRGQVRFALPLPGGASACRPSVCSPSQLETIGRALGELHVIGKGYKKGIDNRFSFERIADLYLTRAQPAAELFSQDYAARSTTRSST